jgi:NodT family efflux transporter outer membrane factor (OMF) lipoprotein
MPPRSKIWLALAAAANLGACTVGPDYAGAPTVATATRFARAQGAEAAAPVAARWWTALADPRLDGLIDAAFEASPNLEAAAARLRRARGLVGEDRAKRAPKVLGSATYIRGALPGDTLGAGVNDIQIEEYSLGANASWEPDLFGKLSRTLEQDRARAQAAEAEMADVRVTLAADIASAYVNLRDQQARLRLAGQILDIQRQRLVLLQQRRVAGATNEQEIVGSQADVEKAASDLSQLQSDVELSLNQLAVLVGREPGALDGQFQEPSAVPLPPAQVAVGDPASLIRRRPDVRQAERNLAAATAGIGVAVSQYYPSVNFIGLLGMGGDSIEDVVDTGKLTKLALPMISWTLLDFGRVKAQVAQSRAGQEEALAQYRGAVLKALEDAEGALSRFGHGRDALQNARRSLASAQRGAQLSAQRYAGGTINRIEDLDVQRQALVAQQHVLESQAGVTKAFIAVEKSLGLGWEA